MPGSPSAAANSCMLSRQPSSAFAEACHCLLEVGDVLVDAQRAEMIDGVIANMAILG